MWIALTVEAICWLRWHMCELEFLYVCVFCVTRTRIISSLTCQVEVQMGGRTHVEHELLYRFVFPERPGALMKFLDTFCPCWNITLFHYRSQVLVIWITHRLRFLITYGYYTKYNNLRQSEFTSMKLKFWAGALRQMWVQLTYVVCCNFFPVTWSVDLATCPLQHIRVNNVVKIGSSVCVDYDVMKSPSLLVNAGCCFVNACPQMLSKRRCNGLWGSCCAIWRTNSLRPSGW